jgi:hypothetical protein
VRRGARPRRAYVPARSGDATTALGRGGTGARRPERRGGRDEPIRGDDADEGADVVKEKWAAAAVVTAASLTGLVGVVGDAWAIPARSAPLQVSCSVTLAGPSASPEAASRSAKERCDDQVRRTAGGAARDAAVDANLRAKSEGRSTRYRGVYSCDVPVNTEWFRAPLTPWLYFASASGRGGCVINVVPL